MNQKGNTEGFFSALVCTALIIAFIVMMWGVVKDGNTRNEADVKLQKRAIERCVKDGGMPLFDVYNDKLKYSDCDMGGVR